MAKKKAAKKTTKKTTKTRSLTTKVLTEEKILTQTYQVSRDVLFRAAPNGMIFAILTDDMGAFFQIDGIAAQLWELFDGKTPVTKLIQKVKVPGTVSRAALAKSAANLIADLEENNLIKKV